MIEQDTVKLLRECDAGIKMGVKSLNRYLKQYTAADLDCRGGNLPPETIAKRGVEGAAPYNRAPDGTRREAPPTAL